MSDPAESVLALFLPDRTLDYFEITMCSQDENNAYITLEEKDDPPVTDRDPEAKIISKGFNDITITDFPLRGKRTLLTFRRRYWQIAGQPELLKREFELCFPGTQLATEFANFLKEKSRSNPDVFSQYRRYALPPDQRL